MGSDGRVLLWPRRRRSQAVRAKHPPAPALPRPDRSGRRRALLLPSHPMQDQAGALSCFGRFPSAGSSPPRRPTASPRAPASRPLSAATGGAGTCSWSSPTPTIIFSYGLLASLPPPLPRTPRPAGSPTPPTLPRPDPLALRARRRPVTGFLAAGFGR
uniref:Predicted protein n=1 Tax=Hordeum vulgare subsp. vulgare TaxID=112509 RepID=F2D3D4_HORVV|nr:predicted protein [Hordeum vulgare subsp. vulgare]